MAHVAAAKAFDGQRAGHLLGAGVDVVGMRPRHFEAEGEFVV